MLNSVGDGVGRPPEIVISRHLLGRPRLGKCVLDATTDIPYDVHVRPEQSVKVGYSPCPGKGGKLKGTSSTTATDDPPAKVLPIHGKAATITT